MIDAVGAPRPLDDPVVVQLEPPDHLVGHGPVGGRQVRFLQALDGGVGEPGMGVVKAGDQEDVEVVVVFGELIE